MLKPLTIVGIFVAALAVIRFLFEAVVYIKECLREKRGKVWAAELLELGKGAQGPMGRGVRPVEWNDEMDWEEERRLGGGGEDDLLGGARRIATRYYLFSYFNVLNVILRRGINVTSARRATNQISLSQVISFSF
jgi:hypothetical protein